MFHLWASPFALKRKGILGMNRRNIGYIARYNPRELFPLVDNKLKTKLLMQRASIAVPKLIGVIEFQSEVPNVRPLVKDWSGFAIKPAKGSGGKGILVITQRDGDRFFKASGNEETSEHLERHISNILAGLYSLGGRTDVALIEELIHFDEIFADYSFEGVPDIRVIVFNGFPVMAMMRLPTAKSDGKANLHQGAVGVGLNIATGRAVRAVQHGNPVTHHPDTGHELAQLQVPQWDTVLKLACRCSDVSGLGYLGADIVFDKYKGPLILELNARPGLAIQTANDAGLLPRLQKIELLGDTHMNVEERVAFSQTAFG